MGWYEMYEVIKEKKSSLLWLERCIADISGSSKRYYLQPVDAPKMMAVFTRCCSDAILGWVQLDAGPASWGIALRPDNTLCNSHDLNVVMAKHQRLLFQVR